jgi:hypothetical protein
MSTTAAMPKMCVQSAATPWKKYGAGFPSTGLSRHYRIMVGFGWDLQRMWLLSLLLLLFLSNVSWLTFGCTRANWK